MIDFIFHLFVVRSLNVSLLWCSTCVLDGLDSGAAELIHYCYLHINMAKELSFFLISLLKG